MNKKILFLDWFNINKGYMETTYDKKRLSEKGKKHLEKYERVWGIIPDYSGHGLKRTKMAYGIKLKFEKPKKTGPLLEALKPWEKNLGWFTVIKDKDLYKCFY